MGCQCMKAKKRNEQVNKGKVNINGKANKYYPDPKVQKKQPKLSKMDVKKGMAIGGCQVEDKEQRLNVYLNRHDQQNQRGISKDGQLNLQWQIQKQKEAERLEMEKGGNYKLIYKR